MSQLTDELNQLLSLTASRDNVLQAVLLLAERVERLEKGMAPVRGQDAVERFSAGIHRSSDSSQVPLSAIVQADTITSTQG